MSPRIAAVLANMGSEMRKAGVPVATIQTITAELESAISQESWRPVTIQDIAREAAKVYVPRIEALEAKVKMLDFDKDNNYRVHEQLQGRINAVEATVKALGRVAW